MHIFRLWEDASFDMFSSTFPNAVAFSPDGTRILVSGHVQLIWRPGFSTGFRTEDASMLFDAASGERLRRWKEQLVAFSPDGKRVWSAGKVWDAETGELVRSFALPSRDSSLVLSPDGTHFLSFLSVSWDNKLSLWDATDGRLLRAFEGRLKGYPDRRKVMKAVFTPDGKSVLAASENGTVSVWDINTGELLATVVSLGDVWITLTPEGFFDASPQGTELVTFVRGAEVFTRDKVFKALHRPDLLREKLRGDPNGLVKAAAAKLAFH